MLPEMRYIRSELLPALRERAQLQKEKGDRQLACWRHEPGICPLLIALHPDDVPELDRLPVYDMSEIWTDPEKMLVSQLRGALTTAFAKGDAVPSVRANTGCGCINTLLGGVYQLHFADKMPWLQERIPPERLREMSETDITESSEFRYALECMRLMKEELSGTGIEVYPMDLQGPVDMAHLWLGDDFFYLVYDDPELILHTLGLAAACGEYAFRRNLEIIRPSDRVCHYNALVLPSGSPMKISEDTSTLLGEEHLRIYTEPITRGMLQRAGGGYIHYCGDNRFLLPIAEQMDGSLGLNFGNPERHALPEVLTVLSARGKAYIDLAGLAVPEELLLPAAVRPDGSFGLFLSRTVRKAEQEELLKHHAALVGRTAARAQKTEVCL